MKTLLVWFSVVFCLVGGAVLEGLEIDALFNPHLALLVFGPVLGYAFYFAGFHGVGSFFMRLLAGECHADDQRLVRHLGAAGALAGFCGFLLFAMHALQVGGDNAAIFRGLAEATLGLFYGALPLTFGFVAFRTSAPRLEVVSLKAARRKQSGDR